MPRALVFAAVLSALLSVVACTAPESTAPPAPPTAAPIPAGAAGSYTEVVERFAPR